MANSLTVPHYDLSPRFLLLIENTQWLPTTSDLPIALLDLAKTKGNGVLTLTSLVMARYLLFV